MAEEKGGRNGKKREKHTSFLIHEKNFKLAGG